MSFTSATPYWVSAYGITLQCPALWRDTTEYGFVERDTPKHGISWEERQMDLPRAYQWLLERRELLRVSGNGRTIISEPWTVPHPQLTIYGFAATFGDTPESPQVAMHVVGRPAGSLVVCSRVSAAEGFSVPAVLSGLSGRPFGAALPPGTYGYYDLCFTWPRPLLPPSYFRFESPDRKTLLRVQWQTAAAEFTSPQWHDLFLLDVSVPVTVHWRDRNPVQTGTIEPPFATVPQKLIFDVARWGATASGPRQETMTFCEARVNWPGRSLLLSYWSSATPPEPIDTWMSILSSINVEP